MKSTCRRCTLLFSSFLCVTANAQTGVFIPTGSMATARQAHTATLLPDGKVLIAGGFIGVTGILDITELYDPSKGTFSAAGFMTTPRVGHTATLLPDGRVLLAGGANASGYLASAELYDPRKGTFSVTGSMTTARELYTATLLPDGQVLVAAGLSHGALASAELYDPRKGTFSTTGSMPFSGYDRSATLLPDGKVLIAGGAVTFFLYEAELYDPSTGTFSATGSMTTARFDHTATLLPDGKVLVAGGGNPSLASAELYDQSTGTFSATRSMATARVNHTATLLSHGKVLVAGGFGSSFDTLASAELYTTLPPGVIFDNTKNSSSPVSSGYTVGRYPASSNVYIDTFPFTVQGESDRLDKVGLLTSIDAAVGPTPSGLSLFLYADSGGKPGAVLESWHGIEVDKTIELQIARSSLHPMLQQGQQYWFGVTTTNPKETAIWWINPAGAKSTGCDFINGVPSPCATLATGAFKILGSSDGDR
jgi:hypothetical protein